METPEEAAKRIFGARASFYTTSATHTDPAVLARVVELVRPELGGLALDIGAGAGHTAFALAPHVACVVGLDLTAGMLREAGKLRAERPVPNVSFCVGDAHALPFPEAAFSHITCRRAAHHFSDIRLALSEMKRVLRFGGRLAIDDRSVPEDDFVDACMNDLDRCHDESHVRQYRPGEWRRMLRDIGLSVEAVEPYTQHRPIFSLTGGVSAENVRRIYSRLNGLTGEQREKLNLREVGGQLHLTHWYVMLAAAKR